KDLIPVAGWPTRAGSRTTRDRPVDRHDAPVVERVRAQGAVIIGKTTTTELGASGFSWSPLTGETPNPWNLGRTAGGSSSGAAVAASCGLATLAVGSDAGGSIRIPAALCGVFGFKPTFGRVPHWPAG